nr:tyrosine recombinase XerC [Lagierella sp.]
MKDYPLILVDFLDYIETIKGRSPSTTKEYGYSISNFLKFITYRFNMDKFKIQDIPEIDIKEFPERYFKKIDLPDLHAYLAYTDRYKNNSTTTRSRTASSLRTFFDYLFKIRKTIEKDPAHNLESPRIQKKNPVYLTLEESKRLINVIYTEKNEFDKKRDLAIIMLFLNCGLRLNELTNIKISDLKDDTLTVVGKGNKERTIYLNKVCNKAIDDYLKVRPDIEDPYLFVSNRNTKISNRTVQRRVDHYLEKAGLDTKVFSVHKLRHTAATLMYKYGDVDILLLKEILGHENVSTTQIYTHVDNEGLRDAVKKNPLNEL